MTEPLITHVEARYEVDKAIIQELNPHLSITLSGYEKLTDQFGKGETFKVFNEELDDLEKKKNNSLKKQTY